MVVIVNGAVVGLMVGGIWRWYVCGKGDLAAGLANESHSEHGCGYTLHRKTRNHHCIRGSDSMNKVSPIISFSDIAIRYLPHPALLLPLPPSSGEAYYFMGRV